jgi:hypothetical protein
MIYAYLDDEKKFERTLGMKRLVIVVALGSLSIQAKNFNGPDAMSKTFFSTRPHYSTGSPEHLSLYRDRMRAYKEGIRGSFQTVFFGGASIASDDLARYFMPFHKICLVVAEGPNPDPTQGIIVDGTLIFAGGSEQFQEDTHDILAQNFNITTTNHDFASKICFEPHHSFIGTALNYKQSLNYYDDWGFWFDMTFPIVHVRNHIHICEEIIHQGQPIPGSPTSITQAFMQDCWKFGKIAPHPLKKTGLADMEVRFGYDSVYHDKCRYGSFFGIIFPTGNKPEGEFVFEPIVGSNGHWGITWGSSFEITLWDNNNSSLITSLQIKSVYLFENTQIRSFDLIDKQWSRYIKVFTSPNATAPVPGINVFTRPMKIRPRGSAQVNAATWYQNGDWDLEFGFNSFYKQSEDGILEKRWEEGPAIAGVNGNLSDSQPAESMDLASMRIWNYSLISKDVLYGKLAIDSDNNSPQFKAIKEDDLNIQSALHPANLSTAVYAAVAYTWAKHRYLPFAGIGSSYIFTADNAAMTRWSFWAKAGISL